MGGEGGSDGVVDRRRGKRVITLYQTSLENQFSDHKCNDTDTVIKRDDWVRTVTNPKERVY